MTIYKWYNSLQPLTKFYVLGGIASIIGLFIGIYSIFYSSSSDINETIFRINNPVNAPIYQAQGNIHITQNAGTESKIATMNIEEQENLFQREKEKPYGLLKIEIGVVASSVNSLLALPRIISITEIPLLQFSAEENQLAKMNQSIAQEVYQLQYMLKKAEESRKVAANLLSEQNRPEFKAHSFAYYDYLRSAKEKIEALRRKL